MHLFFSCLNSYQDCLKCNSIAVQLAVEKTPAVLLGFFLKTAVEGICWTDPEVPIAVINNTFLYIKTLKDDLHTVIAVMFLMYMEPWCLIDRYSICIPGVHNLLA